MTNFVSHWVQRATWTLYEAAHLISGYDPNNPVPYKNKTTHPVYQLYAWLKKEYDYSRLYAVEQLENEPHFVPGTLLRHVRERGAGKFRISQQVWGAYHNKGQAKAGVVHQNAEYIYVEAAKIVWEKWPNATAEVVAKALTQLPANLPHLNLPSYSPVTIRNYLKGRSPHKGGRPKKPNIKWQDIDLSLVKDQLT